MAWKPGGRHTDGRCWLLGCDWEPRRAYDYCRGCGAARWHLAAAYGHEPSAVRGTGEGAVRVLRERGRRVLGLIDCEGSELFCDATDEAAA